MKIKTMMMFSLFACGVIALHAGEFDKELAEVKNGTRTEAKASWWGFSKEDSTKALQDAVNSGVKRLIVDNTGSDWITASTIWLKSDQEIIFEKGVVVAAKKGAFKSRGACLFFADHKKNIVLRGEDSVILKMRKADYMNAKSYQQDEHRHTLVISGCENVTVKNLTLLSSGGDGIYIGNFSKNILIDGVVCDDHYRQGISVICAENLIIKNSIFKNTRGVSPEAGIDFEQNKPGEKLINCVVENCSFTGNKGSGIDIVVHSNFPMSIFIRNCKVTGNTRGIRYAIVRGKKQISDRVEVVDSIIGNSVSDNVNIEMANTSFLFKNCRVDNSNNKSPGIVIWEGFEHTNNGLVELKNCIVTDNTPGHKPLLVVSSLAKPKLSIKGTIKFIQPRIGTKYINCTQVVKKAKK